MRIVYLADAPYIHTRRWVRHFARLGHETHVISFRPAGIEDAKVHYVDGLEAIGKARYVVHARRVRSMIAGLQPDLLHALHLTSYGFLAGLSGFQPSIVSVWGTDVLEAPALTPMHRWITRHALAHAGAITATGLRLAEATLPYTPPRKPVSVIPYGIDTDLFDPARFASAKPQGARPLTAGAVARLSPEKGFEHLLRAAAIAKAGGTDIHVVLGGDGPSRGALEQLAGELGIAGIVRFAGGIAHEDVPALLAQLDLFVMPSTWEGFGVAALEASAMRLPVIASDVHGLPDVVLDGETGILVPPAEPEAIAQAIAGLAGDAEMRRRLGDAGRAFVERQYRWDDNARLMERLYEAMIAGRRGDGPQV